MRKKRFDLISEDALFWLSRTDEPETPSDFHGPYKKEIYTEFYKELPEFVFVKTRQRSISEVILAKLGGPRQTKRPN